MNHEATDRLRHGTCVELPPEVSDKYFAADPRTNPFEHRTARVICRQCVAQVACLEDVISSPAVFVGPTELARAGESRAAIRALRRQHFLSGVPASELAALAIRHQADTPGIDAYRQLRKGNFPNAVQVTDQEIYGDE